MEDDEHTRALDIKLISILTHILWSRAHTQRSWAQTTHKNVNLTEPNKEKFENLKHEKAHGFFSSIGCLDSNRNGQLRTSEKKSNKGKKLQYDRLS